MITVYLRGIGLIGPGLPAWRQSMPVLGGARAYQAAEWPILSPTLLPANERRRTTAVIKLALQAAHEACVEGGADPAGLRSVFASSGGDSDIIDKLCTALTLPDRPLSPTHFHNSVHNAPAGYWAIATSCPAPSVSLSAFDASFSAGLLEAAVTAVVEDAPVLLAVYDHPAPFPLIEARPLLAPFAVALLLYPHPAPERWVLRLAPATGHAQDNLADPELERLRLGNPAARGLPLLRALAGNKASTVVLPYVEEQQLLIEVEPCP